MNTEEPVADIVELRRRAALMSNSIQRIDNRIVVTGELYDLHGFLAQIHAIVETLGYVTVSTERSFAGYQPSVFSRS